MTIVNDHKSPHIAVTAGPGSGKTKLLVHKLAALMLMEDVKHEQMLMLTFSRTAATEFKQRLMELIGNAAAFIQIQTFHSYCFDLLGKPGTLDGADEVVQSAIDLINAGEVEPGRITKTVLVIDEAQDMSEVEYELVKTLIVKNENLRVIAVGDDDQNIYEFRGSDSAHLKMLIDEFKAEHYTLSENYRSEPNIVHFINEFAKTISNRLKTESPRAMNSGLGKINIVHGSAVNQTSAMAQDLINIDLAGTTCVLTRTNLQAREIAGILRKSGIQASLIESNDGFNLFNLKEIRDFIDLLNYARDDQPALHRDIWRESIRKWAIGNKESKHLNTVLQLIRDFENTQPKTMYFNDFEVFIRESKIEDFHKISNEPVFVSTIHKVKGKEFDNVFLLHCGIKQVNDAEKRLAFVGMSRAKKLLHIRTDNSLSLPEKGFENQFKFVDHKEYSEPKSLILPLSHRDVVLSHFDTVQNEISDRVSGSVLSVRNNTAMVDETGKVVVKFSAAFNEKLKGYINCGYAITSAEVNFLVYWKGENRESEILIILPELVLEK